MSSSSFSIDRGACRFTAPRARAAPPSLAEAGSVLPAFGDDALRELCRSPACCCRAACDGTFTTSTPTAAGRTIWPTKPASTERSLQLLEWWEAELRACYAGRCRHPVFVALREHDRRVRIPTEPFARFAHRLPARPNDRRATRRSTNCSATVATRPIPVGRLVLYLGRCHDERRLPLSDAICTGLQLANFWQDVRRDCAKGRVYLPQEDLQRFGVDRSRARSQTADARQFKQLLAFEVDRAEELLRRGLPLVDADAARLGRRHVAVRARRLEDSREDSGDRLTTCSPCARKSRSSINYDCSSVACGATLARRGCCDERTCRSTKVIASAAAHGTPRGRAIFTIPSGSCRRRSGARCAHSMHSFAAPMISATTTVRSTSAATALINWRASLAVAPLAGKFDDPLLAGPDRYDPSLRNSAGVLRDGDRRRGERSRSRTEFATFAELERYCYQVASVVGLACIHVWGFRPRAVGLRGGPSLRRRVSADEHPSRRRRRRRPRPDLSAARRLAHGSAWSTTICAAERLLSPGDDRWRRCFAFRPSGPRRTIAMRAGADAVSRTGRRRHLSPR